jgi:hypothetical protein
MSNLVEFAKKELDILGMEEDSGIDGMMRKHIIHMVEEFSKEGHSGSSASYAINCLKKLLNYEPLSPITGEDDEWVKITDTLYQNKRCYTVFKEKNGRTYNSEGIIFWEWVVSDKDGTPFKSFFTSKDSRVDVEFPYTPSSEYKEVQR